MQNHNDPGTVVCSYPINSMRIGESHMSVHKTYIMRDQVRHKIITIMAPEGGNGRTNRVTHTKLLLLSAALLTIDIAVSALGI